MDYLPVNLILKILENIPIQDRIKLRTISKQFKEIIDFKIADELILYPKRKSNQTISEFFYLSFIEKYLNNNNLIKISDEQIFYSTDLFKFKKIKKLKSFLNVDYLESIDYFNLFEELTELYIDHSKNYNNFNVDFELKLKNLKKLKCKPNYQIKLNTPSLIELRTIELNNFSFIYPEQLLRLKIHQYLDRLDLTKLYKFKNLEQLKIVNNVSFRLILNRELIEKLVNLTKLSIFDLDLNNVDPDNPRLENKIVQLKKFNYRRKNLKILLNELELDQFKSLNDNELFNFWIKSITGDQMKMNKLKLNFINYDKLIGLFNYELPTKFYTKTINIYQLTIDGKIDESKLINFLKGSNVKMLIVLIKLSKSFYNQLNNENVPINILYFCRENRPNLSDKDTMNFVFNPRIRVLNISQGLFSSRFKHLLNCFSNYNLKNYFFSFHLNKSANRYYYRKRITIHVYDDQFFIDVSKEYKATRLPIISYRSEINLIKFEFLQMLNLMTQIFIDNKFDYVKLNFLIDRINLINLSYTIMLKKSFRTYDISNEIFNLCLNDLIYI